MGKKILIVDDEQDVVTYLKAVFEDNGYETVTAVNGEEALEKLKSDKPDLVTLDISMPEKTGTRFYKEVKDDQELRKVPIVIITGITGYGDDKEAFKKFISSRKTVPPPEGFIPKPIDREELLALVAKLLG